MSPRILLASFVVVLVTAGLAFASSCADPTQTAEVSSLPPEDPSVPPGPTHRPGQPCLTCHGGMGPANQTFVTAGTIYAQQYPVDGGPLAFGSVYLVDSTGSAFTTTTNGAGNFYVTPDQWSPVFPLGAHPGDAGVGGRISVSGPGAPPSSAIPMMSAIDRAGVYASCSYCHFDPPGPTTPGHIYLQ